MTSRRLWMAVLTTVALAVGGTSCSKDAEVSANDLQVGDCVEDQATLNSVDVSAIDCDEEHVFELYHRFDLEDADDYPGETEVQAQGDEGCGDNFEDYVGAPPGEIAFVAIPPSQETWEQANDRTILCFATRTDFAPTTGSVEGSGG